MVLAVDHAFNQKHTGIHFQKTKALKGTIAFFDFDGTITTKDTLLEFIKYSKGNLRFYLGFLVNSPWLVGFKLKMISNQKAKERILKYFYANIPVSLFQKQCDDFAERILPGLVRPGALTEIKKLQGAGSTIVIVSASPENWVNKWAAGVQAQVIATRLEIQNEKLTGKILGKNCHGQEKVRRIHEKYRISDYTEILGYGDTGGDLPMLQLATTSFFKPFRN